MEADWTLEYEGLDPKQEGLREALCTLGNGVFATRGAAEEQRANGVHYPGTYVAGGYNELQSEIAGRAVINEDLVNFTNWLCLTFRPIGGDWLDLWRLEVLEYRQALLLREGLLERHARFRDASGRITRLTSRRFVHMGAPHLAGIEWELFPENWSGEVEVHSELDGGIRNTGVARYRQLSNKHLDVVARGATAPEGIQLLARTSQSRFEVAVGARTRVYPREAETERRITEEAERVGELVRLRVQSGQPVRIEKVVALHTSRDRGSPEPLTAAQLSIFRAPGFADLVESHRLAWKWLWHRHDIQIDAAPHDPRELSYDQLAIRLHIFHLLQTASPNIVGRDVGIPARGLHGEAYRGHVFWDELFILPFFALRTPAISRTLMLYRYYRLDAARALAREAGYSGASFPWQSSSDGREATQAVHLNPLSGRWDPDYSRLQRHVNAAIVYNVWAYYQSVGDRGFMEEYGAELIVEIARFWSSIASANPKTGRYDIVGVMGPDEYHERYPGSETGGLRNNAYTNVMASWCLLRALDVLEVIGHERRSELKERLRIDDAEEQRWREVSELLTVPQHDGLLSQFEGYERLEEFDWEGYRVRYGNIERLDRILKAEGSSADRFKVSKQPDVIMLFHLFTLGELSAQLAHMGYRFDEAALVRNIDYYNARTSHGSTLSRVVLTSVVHHRDCEEGCRLFVGALRSDLRDVQGGTTAEGVHLGAMAGTVDIVIRHYAGLALTREGITLAPNLPRRMRRIAFRVNWRGRWIDVAIEHGRVRVAADDVEPEPVPMQIQKKSFEIRTGEVIEVALEPGTQRAAQEAML